MKLRQLKPNQTELTLNDGTVLFFSYQTPVAAFTPKQGYIYTEKKYSVTTSRHINQWLDGIDLVTPVPQSELDALWNNQ